jgi:hypothetical protein
MKSTLVVAFTVVFLTLAGAGHAGLVQTIDYETGNLSQVYLDVDGPTASVQVSTDVARKGTYSMRAYIETADKRAETVNKYVRGSVGGENWYGFSVYLPSNYPGDGRFDIVAQFHDYHGSQPSWALDNKAPTNFNFYNQVFQLDLKYQNGSQSVAHQNFNLGGYTRGAWHDVVMHVKWTHLASGFLKVWVNGAQKVDYVGPTYMDYGSGNGPYFKMGNYKGSSGWSGTSPRIVYVDEFRMGDANSNYAEVDPSPGIVVDDGGAGYTDSGNWSISTSSGGYGGDYRQDGNTGGNPYKWAKFMPASLSTGTYQVSLFWKGGTNRATNAVARIYHANGSQSNSNGAYDDFAVDMTQGDTTTGEWNQVGGTFQMDSTDYVAILNTGANGYVLADAVRFAPAVAASSQVILNAGSLSAYDTTQDGQNGLPTSATVGSGGGSVTLTGNAWKKHPFAYTVTANTVVEVTVNGSDTGEVVGLALDSEGTPLNNRRAFRFGGSDVGSTTFDTWSWKMTPAYAAGSGAATYVIMAGEYFTGTVAYLGFIADDDANGSSNITFSNIRIYEAPNDLVFSQSSMSVYDAAQDGQNSLPTSATVGAGGASVSLAGNAWKKHPLTYTVTANTVLLVTLNSSDTGEIVGIALDNDSTGTNNRRAFRFGGSDVNGTTLDTWSWKINPLYTAGSGTATYAIPVGDYFTGSVTAIGFIGDDDANGSTSVTFSKIKLYDAP